MVENQSTEVEGPTWVEVDRGAAESAIGEGVHAGLRKGSDAQDASRIWRMISDSRSSAWADAVAFCVYGLGEMGLAICRREDTDRTPETPKGGAVRVSREDLEDAREELSKLCTNRRGELQIRDQLIDKITKALEVTAPGLPCEVERPNRLDAEKVKPPPQEIREYMMEQDSQGDAEADRAAGTYLPGPARGAKVDDVLMAIENAKATAGWTIENLAMIEDWYRQSLDESEAGAEPKSGEGEMSADEVAEFATKLLGSDLCERHAEEASKESFPVFSAKLKACGCPRCAAEKVDALESAREALRDARDALSSLPLGCLGEGQEVVPAPDGQVSVMRWSLRDELIDKITKALEGSS